MISTGREFGLKAIATGAALVGVLTVGTGSCLVGKNVGDVGKVSGTQ